jgi:hypothetical protein
MNSDSYPWYYAVNDRPVKFVKLPNGEVDVLVYDFKSGEFRSDMSYRMRVFEHGKDIDKLDADAFEALVDELRRRRDTSK